jgi:hypothetical protein
MVDAEELAIRSHTRLRRIGAAAKPRDVPAVPLAALVRQVGIAAAQFGR